MYSTGLTLSDHSALEQVMDHLWESWEDVTQIISAPCGWNPEPQLRKAVPSTTAHQVSPDTPVFLFISPSSCFCPPSAPHLHEAPAPSPHIQIRFPSFSRGQKRGAHSCSLPICCSGPSVINVQQSVRIKCKGRGATLLGLDPGSVAF